MTEMETDYEERPGLLGRMLGVIVAPGTTFQALAQKTSRMDWLVPTLIMVATALVFVHLTLPLIQEAGHAQLMERLKDLPQEKQQEILEMTGKSIGIAAYVSPPIMTFVVLFIIGGVLLPVGRYGLGGTLTYTQALSVWAYSSLVGVLGVAVRVPLMLAKGTAVVHLGPAILLSDQALQTFAGRVLAAVDIFTLWQVCLTGLGLAILTRSSTAKALTYILALWVAWVLAVAGLGSLKSLFVPGA